QLMETIVGLAQSGEMTVVLVEQQIERALDFADDVLVVERGRIVWRGRAAEFRADRELADRLLGVGIG
ncbi:MAG: ABC transporter ATP-binding protein, partial [Pseudomonadota bacterium]